MSSKNWIHIYWKRDWKRICKYLSFMKFKREREKKRRIIVESTENCNEKNSNEIFWIFKFKFCDASILCLIFRSRNYFFLRKETTLTLSVALSSILGTLESAVIILGWPALAAWWSAVAPVQSVASPFNDSTASARYSTTRTLLPRAAHIKRVYCFCNKQIGCLSRYYIIRMNILRNLKSCKSYRCQWIKRN